MVSSVKGAWAMPRCLAFVPVALVVVCGCVRPSTEAVRSGVQQAVRSYVDATNKRDATAIMEMVSREPGVSSVSDGSITRGWDAIRSENDALLSKATYSIALGSIDV